MGIQIITRGTVPSFANAPRADVTTFYDVDAWEDAGLAFWGRGDGVDPAPATGLFELLDRRTGSGIVARQSTGTVVTTPAPSSGILNARDYIRFANIAQKLVLTSSFMPATGPFAIYLAGYMDDTNASLIGNNATGQFLAIRKVGGQLRFAVEGAEANGQLNWSPAVTPHGKNVALGFIRTADNHLKIRYFYEGAADWDEQVSANAATKAVGGADIAINTSLALGDFDGSSTYYPGHALGGALVHIGEPSAAIQAEYEDYLIGYYGLV